MHACCLPMPAQFIFPAPLLPMAGTLTPIVSNPDLALMSDHTRAAVSWRR